MASRAPEALLTATVLDLDGNRVPLARAWTAQPAVLVLLRHFGCLFRKEQATAFKAVRDDIQALGAHLVYVGSGDVQYARWFVEDFAITDAVYSDTDLVTYRALHARRGFFTSVNPRTWWYSLRALRGGSMQSGSKGDVYQQGAVCIVTPDGSMPYRYISTVAGDHPRPADVIEALRALAPTPGDDRQPITP